MARSSYPFSLAPSEVCNDCRQEALQVRCADNYQEARPRQRPQRSVRATTSTIHHQRRQRPHPSLVEGRPNLLHPSLPTTTRMTTSLMTWRTSSSQRSSGRTNTLSERLVNALGKAHNIASNPLDREFAGPGHGRLFSRFSVSFLFHAAFSCLTIGTCSRLQPAVDARRTE